MNKKKLSILIYSLAGGGAERVVSILLYELKEQYDITLVLMRDKIDYDIPKDSKIYFLENSEPNEHGIKKLLKLPLLGLKYKKFCQKNNIEISLAFMNRPAYVSIFAKLFGNSIKTVISERSTPSMMYQSNNLLSKISKLLIKKLYPKADMIIANSEGNRIDLVDNFLINRDKVITIPNLFDLEKIDKLSKEPVDKIDFSRFTLVTVGRLDRGKNHALMINAFFKLKDNNLQLLIIGEGIEKESLDAQIRRLNLDDSVFLVGFDNNPYKYFSKSDIFLFTSSYEGFPNVLVEALACGLPVISTDCKSGPREILSPKSNVQLQLENDYEVSEYGILVPVNEEKFITQAIRKMVQDKDLIETYQKKSKLRANAFDKKTVIKEFIKILEN